MTARERAVEATWDTGSGDWTTVDRERLEARVEAAIAAAVQDERCAVAFELGQMRGESENKDERMAFDRVAALLDARSSGGKK